MCIRDSLVLAALLLPLLLALLAAGTGTALLLSTSARIARIPVDGLAAQAPAMNVLLVGTDSREGLTPEELQALGTEAVGGQRTDTLLLLSISGGRAAMLSFPRDLWVERCDGRSARSSPTRARQSGQSSRWLRKMRPSDSSRPPMTCATAISS